MMTEVKIYTTPACPWCRKSKEWMKKKKIKYVEYNVASDKKARKRMLNISGQNGVPVIEIGKQIIVGYEIKAIEKALKK